MHSDWQFEDGPVPLTAVGVLLAPNSKECAPQSGFRQNRIVAQLLYPFLAATGSILFIGRAQEIAGASSCAMSSKH